MFDVLAVGELLIDFTPNNTNDQGMALFARNPGGAPANVLAMNTRLGGKTAFIGKVGQDDFGKFLRQTLESSGIDTAGLVMTKECNTTLAFVHLNEHGDRTFSFYRKPGADMMLSRDEIRFDLIDQCSIFHFGAVSLTDEPCRSATLAAAEYARKIGKIISYDPNYRPFLWPDAELAKAEILNAMPLADILKVSEEEMTLLTGETELARGVEKLAAFGPSLILVSLGAKGACYFNGSCFGVQPTFDVATVDTTGAGDAFFGAIHYRLRGKTASDIRAMSPEELLDIIEFANAAGSLTTTRKGAIPAMPELETIENCRQTIPLLKI